MSEQKKQWIGWALTIVLTVISAVSISSGTSAKNSEKLTNCEKRIEKIEIKQECQFEKVSNKLDCLLIAVTELRIEIKHKKDR